MMDDLNHHLNSFKYRLESLAEEYFDPHFCEDVKDYVVKHPFITIALALIALFSALPVAFFLCFALFTSLVAIICFICIEGSLLIIGGLILIGIVSVITIIVACITSAAAVAYWSAQRLHRATCGSSRHYQRNNSPSSRRNGNRSAANASDPNPAIGENVTPDSSSENKNENITEN